MPEKFKIMQIFDIESMMQIFLAIEKFQYELIAIDQ